MTLDQLGYCGDPGTPVNGRRSISGYTEGHTVNYTCNTGYDLSGSATRTCQSNGLWSGSSATCLSKYYAHEHCTDRYCMTLFIESLKRFEIISNLGERLQAMEVKATSYQMGAKVMITFLLPCKETAQEEILHTSYNKHVVVMNIVILQYCT